MGCGGGGGDGCGGCSSGNNCGGCGGAVVMMDFNLNNLTHQLQSPRHTQQPITNLEQSQLPTSPNPINSHIHQHYPPKPPPPLQPLIQLFSSSDQSQSQTPLNPPPSTNHTTVRTGQWQLTHLAPGHFHADWPA